VQDWENAAPAHSNVMFIITTLYAGAIKLGLNRIFGSIL